MTIQEIINLFNLIIASISLLTIILTLIYLIRSLRK